MESLNSHRDVSRPSTSATIRTVISYRFPPPRTLPPILAVTFATRLAAEYGSLFDTMLAADSHAKGKWHTCAGGVYYSVGIGGAVLGRGAHVMLIDDPFASMDEVLSEATRKKVWDWYSGTAYNRLMPGGAIVVISHRMHEDDL